MVTETPAQLHGSQAQQSCGSHGDRPHRPCSLLPRRGIAVGRSDDSGGGRVGVLGLTEPGPERGHSVAEC